jgi:predicted negative regulator of RcsB-dependent stress response
MAFDHEEQEQLASFKAWWQQYGNLLTWVLIAALACYAGWSAWKYHKRSQSAQAAVLYDSLQTAVAANDRAQVQRVATDMQDKFAGSPYAGMSALAAAKVAFDGNDMKVAKERLQWVIDKSGDDEYKSLARVRLAGILLDEKAYDDGLKVLSGNFPPQFESLAADRKGDLLAAQNKLAEARAAYQLALDKAGAVNPARQLIQLKLDAIGGAPAKAAA